MLTVEVVTKNFSLKKLGSHASMTPMTTTKKTTSTTALNLAYSINAFELVKTLNHEVGA